MSSRERHSFTKGIFANHILPCFYYFIPEVQGGALLHSGTLEALTECTFESNMAGEDGLLAVMSLGIINYITDLTFKNNSFFCASGKYGLEEDIDEIEV